MSYKILQWSSMQSYKDRSPTWIRLHRSLLDDYEFVTLPVQARALLPMLWLLAAEHGDPTSGIIEGGDAKIAFRLRINVDDLKDALTHLIERGFMEEIRVRTETVTEKTKSVTPETETETETETDSSVPDGTDSTAGADTRSPEPELLADEPEKPEKPTEAAHSASLAEAVSGWNALAEDLGLVKVQKITGQRKSKLKSRLNDCGGIAGWEAALAKIRDATWMHNGSARNGWKVDFDFVLQEKSFTKLMEGAYDARTNNTRIDADLAKSNGWTQLMHEFGQRPAG